MDKISILEMARGAFAEQVDYEMSKIAENILDENTKASAKRKLTMTITFQPDEERRIIHVETTAKSALASANPVATALWVSKEAGQAEMMERVPQLPGQMKMDGTEQEPPAILKIIKNAQGEKKDVKSND